MKEQKFTISQIEEFHKLADRKTQAERRVDVLTDEILKLEKEKERLEDELLEICKRMEREFPDLESRRRLFHIAVMSDEMLASVLDIKDTHYVAKWTKTVLLSHLIDLYQTLHPQADAVPFKWIKETLVSKYGIETRSISNFFVGMLDDHELIGGNKNRAIKIVFEIKKKRA